MQKNAAEAKVVAAKANEAAVDAEKYSKEATQAAGQANEYAKQASKHAAEAEESAAAAAKSARTADAAERDADKAEYEASRASVSAMQANASANSAYTAANAARASAWRLFLPESWDTPKAAGRRERCRIPEGERHRPRWLLALEMLDELDGTGLRPAVLVADAGYGANADFRHGLENRGLGYVLQVKAEMTAHGESAEPHQPPYGGLGPGPLPRYRTRPVSLREHVLAAGRTQAGP